MADMFASSWRSPVAGARSLSRWICCALSSIPSAAVFSSTRETRLVPGIGAMSSPCASSQARATCAGVAPASDATVSTSSTMRRFFSKLPSVKRGLFLRQSSSAALTHFIVAEDVERAGRFYSDVLGGEIVLAGEPTIVALANSWIIINVGGGPTDDKPDVILEPPQNPDHVSGFLNIRVADIQAVYKTWSERGAHFLTPPIDRGQETRCYLRDPEGHLIEVGQTNRPDRSAD